MNENDKTTSPAGLAPDPLGNEFPSVASSPPGEGIPPVCEEEDGEDFYDGPLILVGNGESPSPAPVSTATPPPSADVASVTPGEEALSGFPNEPRNIPLADARSHGGWLDDASDRFAAGEDDQDSEGPEILPDHAGPELLPDDYDAGMFDATPLKLDEIQRQIATLQKEFQSKIKYDAHKNRIIDELHKELQHYKDDATKKYIKSLVLDLIQFGDNMRKLIRHFESRPLTMEDARKLFNLLETVPSDIDDILYRQGVESFQSDDLQFDATRQRVIGRVESSRPEDDRKIEKAVHPGYEWDGVLIRPELVNVYVFTPNTDISERDDGNEQGS